MKIIINIKLTIMYISTQPDNTFHKESHGSHGNFYEGFTAPKWKVPTD